MKSKSPAEVSHLEKKKEKPRERLKRRRRSEMQGQREKFHQLGKVQNRELLTLCHTVKAVLAGMEKVH